MSFTHITEWQIKDDININVGHCFSDIYGQIIVGHCLSDIYGQVIVVYPSECILLHCCFTLQLKLIKWNKRDRKSNVYIYSVRVYNASFPIC